jgi:hypothetical protein
MNVEYKAISNVIVELRWLSSFLSKLGCLSPFPPILECDNHGATYLIANLVFHSHMKRVEIDFQFVCDMVAKKEFKFSLLTLVIR